mmetsp:Transcript_41815/g.55128  ORF Transcript_41815/g.55128 Transcript_41815/m.55128 type:complete len:173 (-) Transcript_41815:881-1399(-)|eukprot:CAMPEP_0185573962 /NCGR_PEP_ID=MMETSP0434-20130131/5529_1 /TAXON_ID=626734 ORGANISM="Favella taraikaensis, Strain Fe Narragansett Bay" /NCGR_SAMPLE_ID=MMETSP0434 /ASSEMBLY_ACC=CAM_ASM_000379 /LENGTH=172 /DNA_ID=CAMNT_0028190353 /DNA_START=170 /DNA_END=688 /DNA_ORIENTATION=-
MMRWIPFKYESSRLNYTIVSVFMIFFFNYGVIYMYAPMRIPIPYVSGIFNGVYQDFNSSWFEDVGSLIIQVAAINAIMPPVELVAELIKARVLRCYDQRSCRVGNAKTQTKTRKKTLFTFKKLYNGKEFEVHYQYASMLVINWVSFLFAPGLPILFPIALFGMIVLYCTSRV